MSKRVLLTSIEDDGVQRNVEKARYCYTRAIKRGAPEAAYNNPGVSYRTAPHAHKEQVRRKFWSVGGSGGRGRYAQ